MARNPLNRLPTAHRVDPEKPMTFSFDGKTYQGAAGDTLGSALMANGVRILGRSFKLHRPRGLMAAGRDEPNALVQLEGGAFDEPNARASLVPLYDGLTAQGQNAWPTVSRDALGLLGLLQRFLPASFYYKSMMWPSWHFYEWAVRRLAGLGKSPTVPDAQIYHKRNAHCDVLVVGGGRAGIEAALTAAKDGKRVMLLDEQEELGGRLLAESGHSDWVALQRAELASLPDVTVLPRTTATGYYDHNFVAAVERLTNHLGPSADSDTPRERLWRIRAARVVLATGAMERPLVFANNDRPGVMLASAVQTYVNRYGVAPGNSLVFVTTNDSAYRAAFDAHKAGVAVQAVVDLRPVFPDTWAAKLRDAGVEVIAGYGIATVKGRRAVRGVKLAPHQGNGVLGKVDRHLSCDVIAMSGGWTPTIHLYSQAGGKLTYREDIAALVPAGCAQKVGVIGTANGDGLDQVTPVWYTKTARTDKQWVDFQYDVKVSDLALATRENFTSVEHVKRYTTNGMSVDQGKSSNVNALAVMAELTDRKISDVGTTKFRPPYHPATIGSFVGQQTDHRLAPFMTMPAHDWHVANGGVMREFGGWQRPDCYLRPGEDEHQACWREALAVRRSVGMSEGSPLGKIEVLGPDAAQFLNRVYINNMATLKPGKARYGIVCNENGIVIDDGVVVRFADDHYMLHTTSSGAAHIAQWMEEWLQCEWPDLNVMINNVTTQWANVTVSGPKARAVMQSLDSDVDFAGDAFPHMTLRTGQMNGVEVRILRASYTGETSFEVNVPARFGAALWQEIYDAGQPHDITPYGVESLMWLRTEKGYLHIGADTDGNTNPLDIGWGVPISKKRDDFIGRRSLLREMDQREDRRQFIGLRAVDGKTPLTIGGHVIEDAHPNLPVESLGYVTSACVSPTLNQSIGLGIVKGGRGRMGETLYVYANGTVTAVEIVSPTHFDPEGSRLND
ncbi:MAG: 2Fe-2S iron-sulfur cluster-binding protein [Alphaproteobacteria bacterium]